MSELSFERLKEAAASQFLREAQYAKKRGENLSYRLYIDYTSQARNFKLESANTDGGTVAPGQFRKTPCWFHFATPTRKGEQSEHLKVDIANKELARGKDFSDCGEPTIVSRKALNEIAEGFKWFGYKELTEG